jgi:hypothetical protein
VVAAVEDSSVPPPPVAAITVEEGETAVETDAPQAALEPPGGAGTGSADMMVVPSNEDSMPPHRWGITMS